MPCSKYGCSKCHLCLNRRTVFLISATWLIVSLGKTGPTESSLLGCPISRQLLPLCAGTSCHVEFKANFKFSCKIWGKALTESHKPKSLCKSANAKKNPPDWAEQTWRWRSPTTGHTRRLPTTQHVRNVIETIAAVMAFDLANDALIEEERLHVAIPPPMNESLGRERDPSRTTVSTLGRTEVKPLSKWPNKSSSLLIRKVFYPPNRWSTTKRASPPLLLPSQPPRQIGAPNLFTSRWRLSSRDRINTKSRRNSKVSKASFFSASFCGRYPTKIHTTTQYRSFATSCDPFSHSASANTNNHVVRHSFPWRFHGITSCRNRRDNRPS